MSVVLNDQEIMQLIQEKKSLPQIYNELFQMKEKKGHKERDLILKRDDGSLFKIIVRQNTINVLDFSIILGYIPSGSNEVFRLRRYNGKSHEHTNTIEKESFYDFHIHTATQRYQEAGLKEDKYAQVTAAYSDIYSAMDCFVKDCNIALADSNQLRLF